MAIADLAQRLEDTETLRISGIATSEEIQQDADATFNGALQFIRNANVPENWQAVVTTARLSPVVYIIGKHNLCEFYADDFSIQGPFFYDTSAEEFVRRNFKTGFFDMYGATPEMERFIAETGESYFRKLKMDLGLV